MILTQVIETIKIPKTSFSVLHKAQQMYLLQSVKLRCLKLRSNSAEPEQQLQDP